jgi:hypothetical protein
MSGYGLWFSRFAASGEGWLPLVAFGSSAWMFVAAGTAPDVAEATALAAAPTTTEPTRDDGARVADAEWSGFEAPRSVGLTAR